jgi:hypothetical protein
MTRSALTHAERQIAETCFFDLGAGYPIGLAPDWVWTHYPTDPRASIKGVAEDAARHVLNLREQRIRVFSTFSGSVALQRSLSAARSYLKLTKRRLILITTDPCIDIIPAMGREFDDAGLFRVNCGLLKTFSKDECDRLCRMIIDHASPEQGVIAVITSPENPTGAIWHPDQLQQIVQTCARTNSVLIVDHCFLLAGLHDRHSVSPVWDVTDWQAPVIGVWDTGKTVHLDGSKLGFIVCGNADLSKRVEDALSVVQYALPDHLSKWVTEVMTDSRFSDIVAVTRETIRKNQGVLANSLSDLGIECFGANAGSFELLKIDVSQSHSVGTVPLESFVEDPRLCIGWRRVALARPSSMFERAAKALLAQAAR